MTVPNMVEGASMCSPHPPSACRIFFVGGGEGMYLCGVRAFRSWGWFDARCMSHGRGAEQAQLAY